MYDSLFKCVLKTNSKIINKICKKVAKNLQCLVYSSANIPLNASINLEH